MTKKIKAVLIVSLQLNVGLIIGFGFYHSFVRSQMFKSAAMTFQAEANVLRNILSKLESDDPEKITALKERLQRDIEQAQKGQAIWEQAATQ